MHKKQWIKNNIGRKTKKPNKLIKKFKIIKKTKKEHKNAKNKTKN